MDRVHSLALANLSSHESWQLNSLLEETDPTVLSEGLFSFGLSLENSGKISEALQIYRQLHAKQSHFGAAERIDAISGKGKVSRRFEFLLSRFAQEAGDYRSIVPMVLGSSVYQLTRAAALGRLPAAPAANWYQRGRGARMGAGLTGFAAETSSFTLLSRTLRKPDSSFSTDLVKNSLTLGALKIFGALGQTAQGSLALPFSVAAPLTQKWLLPLNRFLLTQGSVFCGIMAAHDWEMKLGLKPKIEGSTALTDTLASMVSLGVGAHLGKRFLGKGFDGLNTEGFLRAEHGAKNSRSTPGGLWAQAPAGAAGKITMPFYRISEAKKLIHMASQDDSREGGALSKLPSNTSDPWQSLMLALDNSEVRKDAFQSAKIIAQLEELLPVDSNENLALGRKMANYLHSALKHPEFLFSKLPDSLDALLCAVRLLWNHHLVDDKKAALIITAIVKHPVFVDLLPESFPKILKAIPAVFAPDGSPTLATQEFFLNFLNLRTFNPEEHGPGLLVGIEAAFLENIETTIARRISASGSSADIAERGIRNDYVQFLEWFSGTPAMRAPLFQTSLARMIQESGADEEMVGSALEKMTEAKISGAEPEKDSPKSGGSGGIVMGLAALLGSHTLLDAKAAYAFSLGGMQASVDQPWFLFAVGGSLLLGASWLQPKNGIGLFSRIRIWLEKQNRGDSSPEVELSLRERKDAVGKPASLLPFDPYGILSRLGIKSKDHDELIGFLGKLGGNSQFTGVDDLMAEIRLSGGSPDAIAVAMGRLASNRNYQNRRAIIWEIVRSHASPQAKSKSLLQISSHPDFSETSEWLEALEVIGLEEKEKDIAFAELAKNPRFPMQSNLIETLMQADISSVSKIRYLSKIGGNPSTLDPERAIQLITKISPHSLHSAKALAYGEISANPRVRDMESTYRLILNSGAHAECLIKALALWASNPNHTPLAHIYALIQGAWTLPEDKAEALGLFSSNPHLDFARHIRAIEETNADRKFRARAFAEAVKNQKIPFSLYGKTMNRIRALDSAVFVDALSADHPHLLDYLSRLNEGS